MADETDLETADKTTTPNSADAPVVKKTRKPRTPKAAAETATVADNTTSDVPVKKTRTKRGSKMVAAKTPKGTSRAAFGRTPVTDPVAKTSSPVLEQPDEFADLIKLEEENKNLRKQLSEKLRAENADLRKRLGQS